MTILTIRCLSSQNKWETPGENILRWETSGDCLTLFYKHGEPTVFELENQNAVLRFLLSLRNAVKNLPVNDQSIDVTTFVNSEEEQKEETDEL